MSSHQSQPEEKDIKQLRQDMLKELARLKELIPEDEDEEIKETDNADLTTGNPDNLFADSKDIKQLRQDMLKELARLKQHINENDGSQVLESPADRLDHIEKEMKSLPDNARQPNSRTTVSLSTSNDSDIPIPSIKNHKEKLGKLREVINISSGIMPRDIFMQIMDLKDDRQFVSFVSNFAKDLSGIKINWSEDTISFDDEVLDDEIDQLIASFSSNTSKM